MSINSIWFLAFAAAALFLVNLVGARGRKEIVLLALNAIFMASFAGSLPAAVPFLCFIAIGYVFQYVLAGRSDDCVLSAFIIVIVASFVYLKRYAVFDFVPGPGFPYMEVGLSYILFRIIHLLVDLRDGMIREPLSPVTYFNYVCFFPNFIAGPIQRFEDFYRQLRDTDRPSLTEIEIFQAFSRMVNGYIKVIFVSTLFFTLHEKALVGVSGSQPVLFYGAAAGMFYLHFYYNFSGYMDVVIGLGRLLGFDIPENFNEPFKAKNFLEFWTRWHITLADWFRSYLFNPLVKILMHRTGNPRLINLIGVAAFFVTFLVMGLWHGTTGVFLVYGLFLSFGVSLNKLYQVTMAARLGRKRYARIAAGALYGYLGRGFTFAYIAIALTCLWTDMAKLTHLADLLGAAGLGGAFLLVAVAAAVVMWVLDRVEFVFAAFTAEGFWARNFWLAGKSLFIISVVLVQSKAVPEIAYKAF